jgi:alpha-beta hydrolase superfamily lysophospholipase
MKQLLDLMNKENPELPRFAFGHSLGPALTQAHIQNWGSNVQRRHLGWHVLERFPG